MFFIFSVCCITGCGAASGFAPSANNLIAVQQSQPPTFSTIYNFGSSGSPDGVWPYGALAKDPAGNLYGTASGGGLWTFGTVFKIDPSGNYAVLHTFRGSDGAYPNSGVFMDSMGSLYGTTLKGSSLGTVFRLDSTGNLTTLHFFHAGPEGSEPIGLIIDPIGNLYGTTAVGGDVTYYPGGDGVIFKIDPSGNYSVLYIFTGGTDGSAPRKLVRDSTGNLYGATESGGSLGYGTLFKLDSSGNKTVLYSFTGPDGANPYTHLITDPTGNLYGVNLYGSTGIGTLFKLDSSGNKTVLYSFTPGADWLYANLDLIMDPAFNLYGTTYPGGSMGYGTVFKVDPSGSWTVLHSFAGTDGVSDPAGLIMDPSGNLYGTTYSGGSSNNGTVFKITLTTPFSAFDAKLNITAGPHARLQLKAAFTQGSAGGAIDPVTQGIMLAIGPYTAIIPAGAFHMRNNAWYEYEGTINGVALQIRILQTRTNSYQVQLEASGMDLTSLTNPVPVTLTIGSNTGTTQVTAAHGL